MSMTLTRFQRALDVYGADLSRWPHSQRSAAERLMASDPAAAAAFAQARGLDALIARDATSTQADAAAVLRALDMRPLPPQRRRFLWRHWPNELLNLDFAPAWPRLAALAGVAALGFIVGLTDLAPISSLTSGDEAPSIVADNDIGAVVFAPDPLPEVRP
jgi:anti-sigma factor RsiW